MHVKINPWRTQSSGVFLLLLCLICVQVSAQPMPRYDEQTQAARMRDDFYQHRALKSNDRREFRQEHEFAESDSASDSLSRKSQREPQPRPSQLTPEERRTLRQQINEARHDIYAPGRFVEP